MTEVSFHFNVADKLLHTCRLLRKAYLSGAKVAVIADRQVLSDLDLMLWTFSASEFVPHCRLVNGADPMTGLSVLLVESLSDCPHQDVLVNLGHEVPGEFERFTRFIEVVSLEANERLAARDRWKHYAVRGYAMKQHDLAVLTDVA